jgi:putative endonuclease
MSWLVYLLECGDGTLYCGVTTDMERRLAQHNGELPGGAAYTRGRRPVRLVACRACPDRSSAQQAEWRIRRLPRAAKIEALTTKSPETSDASEA